MLHDPVDLHLTRIDQLLGLRAARGPAFGLQKIVQRNIRPTAE